VGVFTSNGATHGALLGNYFGIDSYHMRAAGSQKNHRSITVKKSEIAERIVSEQIDACNRRHVDFR